MATSPQDPPLPPAVTPNLFGIAFGLAGLGATWLAGGVPGGPVVADVLFVTSGAVLVVLVVAWARSSRARTPSWPDAVRGGLADRRFGPFLSLAPVTAALLASHLPWTTAARAGVLVATALCLLLAGLLLGDWMRHGVSVADLHAGYFLPTVAGGFVTANALAVVGLEELGMVMFGSGLVFWLLLGPVVLGRLLVGPPLPVALQPTSAINLAPAVVGANAWHALGHGVDVLGYAFAGTALVLLLVESGNLPRYRRVPFGPGYWSYTFVAAAAAAWAMRWIERELPDGAADVGAAVVLAAVTALVGGIASVTVLRLLQRRFLPAAAR